MAFSQFPDTQYFVQLTDTQTVHHVATFKPNTDIDLGNVQMYFRLVGSLPGFPVESFYCLIYSVKDFQFGQEYAISTNYFRPYTDVSSSLSNWYGYYTFSFDRIQLEQDKNYYLAVYPINYTPAADDSYYWAVSMDWPNDINTATDETNRGAQFSLLGYVEP